MKIIPTMNTLPIDTEVVLVNPVQILIVPTQRGILPLAVGLEVRMETASYNGSRIPSNNGLDLAYSSTAFWYWNKKGPIFKSKDKELLEVVQKCLSILCQIELELR